MARIRAVGMPVISPNVDIAKARLTFSNGCVANVTASRVSMRKQSKIRIFQEDAYVSMDFVENQIQIYRRAFPQGPGGLPDITGEVLETKKGDAPREEIRSFVDCAKTGARPRVSGTDGLMAHKLPFRIIRKMRRR